MFVAIENAEMNAQNVDEWINNTRKANGGVISPEFAMEILSKTNHIANIKKVIKIIKSKCVDESKKLVSEKIVPYREFILSCVDGREQSEMIMTDLTELAEACGCKDELEIINNNEKVYSNTECQTAVVTNLNELEKVLAENKPVRVIARLNIDKSFMLENMDFSNVKELSIVSSSEVCLNNVKNLPKKIDVSEISFISIEECDFSRVEEFKIKEKAIVYILNSSNLKGIWDFSKTDQVTLDGSDFSQAEVVKLGKRSFINKTIVPKVVDVTMMEEGSITADWSCNEKCVMILEDIKGEKAGSFMESLERIKSYINEMNIKKNLRFISVDGKIMSDRVSCFYCERSTS
jgi:hypothetical protein